MLNGQSLPSRGRATTLSAQAGGTQMGCRTGIAGPAVPGQVGEPHRELADRPGRLSPLANGPDHQRLPAAHLARREHVPD